MALLAAECCGGVRLPARDPAGTRTHQAAARAVKQRHSSLAIAGLIGGVTYCRRTEAHPGGWPMSLPKLSRHPEELAKFTLALIVCTRTATSVSRCSAPPAASASARGVYRAGGSFTASAWCVQCCAAVSCRCWHHLGCCRWRKQASADHRTGAADAARADRRHAVVARFAR